MRWWFLVPAVALVSVAPVGAQIPKSLGAPTAVLSYDFSHIAGIRELPNGNVLVSDDRDRVVVLADFTAGTGKQVGREGAGPGEYARPGVLLAVAGGRTLLLDPGNARFLAFDPAGATAGTVSPAARGRSPQGGHMLALAASWDARGTDDVGRVYFEQLPGPLRPGESRSVPIVSWEPATGALDTVATYTLSDTMLTLVPQVRGREAAIRPRAWPARPQWAVAPDGGIALAQPFPYHLSWLRGSRRTDGSSVSYTPLRVTPQDRAAFLEEVRGARASSRPSGGGTPSPAGGRPPLHKTEGEPLFPDAKPPFSGRDAIRVGPDGVAWVTRTRSIADSLSRVDLFDPQTGNHISQLVLPSHTRIVGFGERNLYLARRDSDDLERLERYRWP